MPAKTVTPAMIAAHVRAEYAAAVARGDPLLLRGPLRIERESPIFTRADPAELARFDPATRICTMNCGPHRDDPRTEAERKLLCPDCWIVGQENA